MKARECCNKVTKVLCCDSDSIYPTPYKFDFNGQHRPQQNQKLFQTNFVRTSKYTPLSFFPKALLLQFKRLANIYFLVIAILQSIAVISPLNPVTAWIPLIVVLAISMARQGYEDYQRIVSDRETNYGTMTQVYRDGAFVELNWSKVVVGDIVLTNAEEMFPADLILISSSADGAAFIETASLDGQKNLKPKNSFKSLIPYNTPQKLSQFKGTFQTGEPDKELHKFSAQMSVDGLPQTLQINNVKQLLYRGTRLKNTKWIYGLVVFTGRNTKIMLNSKSETEKMSQIQKKINLILVFIFGVQIILSIVVSIGFSVFRRQNASGYFYIDWNFQYGVALDSFLVFLSQFVLINTMIPISLIVSIEIVKFMQSIFIQKDKLLYSEYRSRGVTVKSASLNEQLGQIQYIFSDKTGTLTMNIMQFKIAVVADQMFGDLTLISPDKGNKIETDEQKFSGFKDEKLKQLLASGAGEKKLDRPIVITDSTGGNELKLDSLKQTAVQYMKALALAHQVMPDKDKNGNKVYLGPSPDEITLVEGAKNMGYEYMKSSQSQSTVNINGMNTNFELLQVFEFNSDRKRMSVVIRDNGKLKMYMKGADSIVQRRLSKNNKLGLSMELEKFSVIGLRTLLIAMKTLSEQQYKNFRQERGKLKGMPAAQKQQAQNNLISKLEENMYVIGATAVLDRLQDEVPQTIRDLLRANVKVWMLTGDKMQTAENIAKSCNLIQSEFQVLKFKPVGQMSEEQLIQKMKEMVEHSNKLTEQQRPKGLVIDGNELTPILKSQGASDQLAQLAKNCEAVVCCRLLPSQKADVVRLVRNKLKKITLAIGDGANDVPMIKEAHIGVGLFGEEGMGAVQASDYALPEFRMLWRLLLVHGRWNYIRISEMTLYFFYKNMLFTLPQFFLAFYNGYSAQTIFDDWYVTLYNLVFTSVPLLIRAIFEQDVNYIQKIDHNKNLYENVPTIKTLVKQEEHLPPKYKTNKYLYRLFPKIYFIGQQNCIFNIPNFIAWVLQAVIQSSIIFFFTLYILSNVSVNESGINTDFWLVGLIIYTTIILMVTFKLVTHTKFWSYMLLGAILFFSIGLYILHMWVTNFALTNNILGTTRVAWQSFECYFIVILCIIIVLFVDGVVVFLDFQRGGYASRMRQVIKEQKYYTREMLNEFSLTITDNVTTATQKIQRKDFQVPRSTTQLR